jgi:DNA-binding MarR family transcriptional regulator
MRIHNAVGHLIRRAMQAHTAVWPEEVGTELTSLQFSVLNEVRAQPGIDQRTLGERIALDKSTTADLVARLVRRGLLERTRDEFDARRNVLRLTDAGMQAHTATLPSAQRTQRRLLARLSAEERATFKRLLGVVIDASPDDTDR